MFYLVINHIQKSVIHLSFILTLKGVVFIYFLDIVLIYYSLINLKRCCIRLSITYSQLMLVLLFYRCGIMFCLFYRCGISLFCILLLLVFIIRSGEMYYFVLYLFCIKTWSDFGMKISYWRIMCLCLN